MWADGVHFNVRLEDDRLCTLVLLGARQDGTKELLAVVGGHAGVEFEDGRPVERNDNDQKEAA